MANTAPLSFAEQQVMEVLKQNGLGQISEANKQAYVPQLAAEVEYRLGLELMPKLNEAQAKECADLMDDEQATAETWAAFWRSAIPDFDSVVQRVLEKFSADCQKLLAK